MMADRSSDNLMVTHASIFVRLRENDHHARELAWHEFYDRYAPIIAGFARKLGAKSSDMDDVVQDVLTQFYTASDNFSYDPDQGRFRGYLKVATIRTIKSMLGKRAKYQEVPLDSIPDVESQLDDIWNDNWRQQLLDMAIERVRDEYKNNVTFQAFDLYANQHQSPREVSQQLGLSVNGVYQAKKRITEALKSVVERLDQEIG